jgi:molecular chaperone HtpG
VTNLKADAINVLIIHDEKARRMADMMEMYGMAPGGGGVAGEGQAGSTLLVNMNNAIVRHIIDADDGRSALIINHLFDLALLSQGALNLNDVEAFIRRNEELLGAFIAK